MELYKEILGRALAQGEIKIMIEDHNIAQIVENKCYIALQRIKDILHDDTLNDEECFLKIDEVICVFEELGSTGGDRHDFG